MCGLTVDVMFGVAIDAVCGLTDDFVNGHDVDTSYGFDDLLMCFAVLMLTFVWP